MTSLRPVTRGWFAVCLIGVLITTALLSRLVPVTHGDWFALAVLTFGAAIAHRYPVHSTGLTTFRLTNVFLLTGTLILPFDLLPILIVGALLPEVLLERRRATGVRGILLNAPASLFAAQAAAGSLYLGGIVRATSPYDLARVVAAAALFLAVQNLLLAAGIALNTGLPLCRVPLLSPTMLRSEALLAMLGVGIAGLWTNGSLLLLLIFPLLIVAHQLTRVAHLAELAQTDSKTGLHNARHFEQALAEELALSLRLGRPLTLLVADIDHFKEVNDRFGHASGDQLLQEFATIFVGSLRPTDQVARFGGEEFVALLAGTDPETALAVAERVRATIAAHTFTLPNGDTLRRTVSIGLASAPHDAATVTALFEQADRAMYRAKQTRNAVARSSAPLAVPRLGVTTAADTARPTAARPAAPQIARHAAPLLWLTIALGGLGLLGGLIVTMLGNHWLTILPLLLLTFGAELLAVPLFEGQKQRMTFTFTIAVVMAAMAIHPSSAPLIAGGAALFHVVQQRQWRRGIGKSLFNIANPALAAAAGFGYLALRPAGEGWLLLLAIAAATVTYYVVNVGVVTAIIAAHTGNTARTILRDSLWSIPVNLLLGLTGGFLGANYEQLGTIGTAIFVMPLIVMRFTLAYTARKNRATIVALEAAKAEVEGAHAEKEQTLRQLIATVASIIDARDQAVAGHSERVATYALAIGEELGLSAGELAYLHAAGLLHDLGKVAVPEAILHKPAKLTAEEYAVVKEHAAIGERILTEVVALAEVARMVGDHHERFDGQGYPHREGGAAISQGGRILAVADTLDSILSDRPYSAGKPLEWALAEAERCAGAHFDPAVVAALHRVAADRGPEFFARSKGLPLATIAEPRGVLIPFPSTQPEKPRDLVHFSGD
jgi:diguanylate cyclase (GGDEF)-like protein/putative nucleotidyltransferase with HDIG domain